MKIKRLIEILKQVDGNEDIINISRLLPDQRNKAERVLFDSAHLFDGTMVSKIEIREWIEQ